MSDQTLGPVQHNACGWEFILFKDRNDKECSLQVSSLADYAECGVSALWLGPNDPEPKCMASDAPLLMVETEETTGWVPYPIPPQVHMVTRAHLSRENVAALILHLQAWLETGSLEVRE